MRSLKHLTGRPEVFPGKGVSEEKGFLEAVSILKNGPTKGGPELYRGLRWSRKGTDFEITLEFKSLCSHYLLFTISVASCHPPQLPPPII